MIQCDSPAPKPISASDEFARFKQQVIMVVDFELPDECFETPNYPEYRLWSTFFFEHNKKQFISEISFLYEQGVEFRIVKNETGSVSIYIPTADFINIPSQIDKYRRQVGGVVS